jgi:hypothetical protein
MWVETVRVVGWSRCPTTRKSMLYRRITIIIKIKIHASLVPYSMQTSHKRNEPNNFFFFLQNENASGVNRILQEPRFVSKKVRGVTPDTLKSQDFPSQNLPRHLDSAVDNTSNFFFLLQVKITKNFKKKLTQKHKQIHQKLKTHKMDQK